MSPPDTRTSEFTNAASIHSLAITRLNPAMSDFMSAGAHRPESDETAVAKRASRFGRARTFGSSLALALIAASAAGESTTRINVSSSGEQANGECRGVGISADGRFVVFASDATNLVAGDTNGVTDVFIRDRAIGTTQRVSVASDGSQANAASTSNPAISGNGRFVAFTTAATNLGNGGLFVHDLQTGTTTAAAVGTDASNLNPSASISEDGRFIAFVKRRSTGPNAWFDEVHTVDWTTGNDRFLALETNASAGPPSLSENARRVAFSRTSHSTEECIVWDLSSNSTTNVYVTVDGFLPNGSLDRPLLSGAGRYVAFTSTSSNLVARDFNAHADVFVRDLVTQTTSLVSLTHTGDFARSNCNLIAISSDGRWVAFTSRYGSLVRGDANHAVDVFLRDLSTGALSRVSLGDSGAEAWNACVIGVGALSRDARAIVFESYATNLVDGDTNELPDAFVRDRTILTSVRPDSGASDGGDLVTIVASNFDLASGTQVTFGGAAAAVGGVTGDRVIVRTPPGTGTVDVRVFYADGSATLASGYTYLEPALAARAGNVNVALGDREDVLLANALTGDPLTREVDAAVGQLISLVMASPSSRLSARFVLYAWRRVPSATTLTTLPSGVGRIVCPPPFSGNAPQPIAIWNNVGFPRALGAATFASRPAPSRIFNRPTGAPARFTFQGLIEDTGAANATGFSVTNAILLTVR